MEYVCGKCQFVLRMNWNRTNYYTECESDVDDSDVTALDVNCNLLGLHFGCLVYTVAKKSSQSERESFHRDSISKLQDMSHMKIFDLYFRFLIVATIGRAIYWIAQLNQLGNVYFFSHDSS